MIGRTNVGGDGLNFALVAGTAAPASAKENTIWVNTRTGISTYAFGAANPFTAPAEGAVWILTAGSGSVVFNALKKNIVNVYPVSAQQYVGGAWVAVEAKIYQRGAWQEWWSGQLYEYGNEWQSVTGGWISGGLKQGSSNTATAPTVTKGGTSIVISQAKSGSNGNGGYLATAKDIDVTKYSSVNFEVSKLSVTGSNNLGFMVFDRSITTLGYAFNSAVAYSKASATTPKEGTYTIDVTSVTGTYAIAAYLYNAADSNTPTVTIHKVWLK